MLESLTWWRALSRSDIAGDVEDRRQESLRFFVGLATAAYLLWHLGRPMVDPARTSTVEQIARHWGLTPIVLAGLLLTYALLRRGSRLAAPLFLASSLVSITSALWLVGEPVICVLYPIVALAAVVLLDPLAGLLVGGASIGLTQWMATLEPPLVDQERVFEVGVAAVLTVAAAWALGRNMIIALEWSATSFAQAIRNQEEARNNRAELARALHQLDQAYYRLQRANAALELAWKAAEAAERSKSEFVTNISHELRTPLNLVVGFSEMILTSPESYREPLPASYRGDLNAIYRSAQHLLTLTNDVIDLARVGAGRLALVREPVDLGQVIADACEIVREYVAAKRLRLRIDVQRGLPTLEIDRLRIRQVLLNLLTNAARFTERGGLTVTARLAGDCVTVQVIDTGRGIPQDELPRLFEEFYHEPTAHPRTPGNLGGIGLGLPISKRFVELHGGQMGVESTVGRGTTFWFTLPITPVEGLVAGSRRGPRPVRPSGPAERVLVLAGPDDQLADFVRRHLRGYRVLQAPDMLSAVETAVETRALAIVADREASTGRRESPVPIVSLPGWPGRGVSAPGRQVSRLLKPVSRADLLAALDRLGRPLETILVVDDDPRFSRLITRMLAGARKHARYEVVLAHNGREALELMAARRPDLVLLDLVMPELDGAGVLDAMGADPSLREIPVIVLSAQDEFGGNARLHGALSVERADGFSLEGLLGTVEAVVGSLEPPREYLAAEPAVARGRPGRR